MRPVVVAALVALLVVGSACGRETSAASPGAVAGNVVELSGAATATRGGATRELAVDSDVFADDIVETAAGAELAIVLAHNEARWVLGGGQKRRVNDSAAWRAQPGSPTVAILDDKQPDRTAAAGRHTEREAAETVASAEPEVHPLEDVATTEQARPRRRPRHAPRVSNSESAPRSPSRPADQADGLLGGDLPLATAHSAEDSRAQPVARRAEVARQSAIETASVRVRGGLDEAKVKAVLREVASSLQRCAAGAEPGQKSSLKLSVGADGALSKISVGGGNASVGDCARQELSGLRFPVADGDSTISLTLRVK
jgi:hypothetical protein